MFDYTPMILKFWVEHCIKSPKFIFIVIFLEYFSIWAECLNTMSRLLKVYQGNGRIDADDLNLSKLNTINPVYYVQKFILGENTDISQCSSTGCSMNNSILLLIFIVLLVVMFTHHLWGYIGYHTIMKKNISQASEDSNSKLSDKLNFLLINVLDLIFKIGSVFIYYIFFNKIFVCFYFNADILYGILSIILILLFSLFSFFNIKYVLLFLRLDNRDSLHYDNFSTNYDTLFLILKIIISLNKNLVLINNNDGNITRLIISLDYLILFFVFNFVIKSIMNITNDKNLNIVTNLGLNLFRLFNVLYICLYVIIQIFFNLISSYQIVLTIIGTFLISIAVIIYLYNKIHTLIYGDEKIIFQLIFLLGLFLQGEAATQEFERESIKVKSFHGISCKKKEKKLKCSLCEIQDLKVIQDQNDPEKINLLTLMFSFIEENIQSNFSQDEDDLFNLMNLIFNFNLTIVDTSISHFKYVYKAKDLIRKNEDRKNNYYFNLVFYSNKINYQADSDLKKFSIVKNYDSSLVSLGKSIEIVKEIVDTIESRVKKDLYPQTNELNNLKLSIKQNLENIHRDKNFYNDNFSFVMTKFIFEKTFNIEANSISKVLYDSEDFDSKHDMIADHFKKDSFMAIRYQVDIYRLTISRASKNFKNLQGKLFSEIFPKQFRELGKTKFINEINSNTENFSFEFLQDTFNKNSLDFVNSIKLESKIFRSPDLQEIFCFSNFESQKDDIIVFETPLVFDPNTKNYNPDLNKSSLVTFSEKLHQILVVDPKFLSRLQGMKIQKKYLLFNEIFRKVTLMGSNNKFNQNEPSNNSSDSNGTDFILNYRHYYNFFDDLEKNISSLDNTESIVTMLQEAKTHRDSNSSLNIRLTLKFTIKKSETSEFFIFSFKNFSPKKLSRGFKDDNHREGIEVGDLKNIQLEDEMGNLENSNKSSSALLSSSASSTGVQALQGGILSTLVINGKKSSSLLTSDSKMAGFTITTLVINVSLGLYCLFFLFMGMSSNSQMQELNLLKTSFNSFERMFYQTALSQFYNVGVYRKGTTYMDDYLFGGYWDKFAAAGLTINMGDYANSELYVKTDFLKEKMGTLQDFIYSSSFKDVLDPIFNFQVRYKVLSNEASELKLMTLNPTFFETILNFMNNAKASVFYTTNTMIYIHNYDLHTENYDISSIFNKNVTNVQKAVYEAIFNFPVYLNNLNKIWGQLQELYYSNVDSIFNLNLYLSITLIGLHVFLLFVSVGILNFLKKITMESNSIYSKIIQGEWANYLSIKLIILKDMINFYKIDPIKSSSNMRRQLSETAKITKEKQNNDEKMFEHADKMTQAKTEDAQIEIQNLITPLSRVLFYLFSSYLIYAISFIFIFKSSQSDIIRTSKFSSNYLQVDKAVMNSILLLQCILFSNQTDYSLNQYMKNYTTFISDPDHKHGYIWNLLEDSKLSKIYLAQLEKTYQKYADIEERANEASFCDYLYGSINDDVFSVTKKLFPGDSLIKNLIILCRQYPVTGEKYYTNIVEEINYIGAKMIRNYNHSYGDYTKMKATNDETEFFDEFTIAVMIIRPIQTYILNTHIGALIKSTEDEFVLFIIIFMIGNILMECLIFLVINRKLIRRVLIINDEIRCLTLCLTA